MKATLTFDLPEEQPEHLAAVHGMDWKLVAWRLSEFLHQINKHEIPTTTQQISDHLHEQIEVLGLSLED
jgi:hypothetical protein